MIVIIVKNRVAKKELAAMSLSPYLHVYFHIGQTGKSLNNKGKTSNSEK